MSPVGAIFVPFPPKTGTNMIHPPPQSLNLSTTYRIPLPYSHTVFQYVMNDEEMPKRRSFLTETLSRFSGVEVSRVGCIDFFIRSVFSKIEYAFARNQQFKVGSFAFGVHKLGKDFSHAL